MAISSEAFRQLEGSHPYGNVDGGAMRPQAVADALGTPRRFPTDRMMLREGTEIASLFEIRTGLVKLVRHLPNGRARIVGLHGPGAVLGSPASDAGGAAHPHSVITLGNVSAVSWQAGQLRR